MISSSVPFIFPLPKLSNSTLPTAQGGRKPALIKQLLYAELTARCSVCHAFNPPPKCSINTEETGTSKRLNNLLAKSWPVCKSPWLFHSYHCCLHFSTPHGPRGQRPFSLMLWGSSVRQGVMSGTPPVSPGQSAFPQLLKLRAGCLPWLWPLPKGLQHYPRAYPSPDTSSHQAMAVWT